VTVKSPCPGRRLDYGDVNLPGTGRLQDVPHPQPNRASKQHHRNDAQRPRVAGRG